MLSTGQLQNQSEYELDVPIFSNITSSNQRLSFVSMVTWNTSGAESELELLLGNTGSEVMRFDEGLMEGSALLGTSTER